MRCPCEQSCEYENTPLTSDDDDERDRVREKRRGASLQPSFFSSFFLWLLLVPVVVVVVAATRAPSPVLHLQSSISKAEWIFRSFAPSLPRLQPRFNARLPNTTKE